MAAFYKEDIVSIELNTGSIHRSFLQHSIGKADNAANWFGVRLFRDGEPVNIEGSSVSGYFKQEGHDPIAITSGNFINGNLAEVLLPQACYNYEGQFVLAIKLINTDDGVTSTMRIIDGIVDNTNTGGAVAPTDTIPTYQEILAVYDQMVAAKSGSVRFDITQELTSAQSLKARNNISSASQADMDTVNGKIGNTPLPTTAQTLTGAIDEINTKKVENKGGLTSADNLNDVKGIGFYRWIGSSAPVNSPTTVAASMIVFGSTARPTQFVINISGKAWIRGYNNPNWSAWMKVADQSNVDDIISEIGNTTLPTTAQTLTGAIAEHETDIMALLNRKVNGHALSSDVTVTKSDVGLGNCDNTSDEDKPISMAQAEVNEQLSGAISDEVTARNNADDVLGGAILAEVTDRQNAIAAINNKIGTVPSGKTVEGQIEEEAAERASGDTAINNKIGSTALPTTAQTLTGAIDELYTNKIENKGGLTSSDDLNNVKDVGFYRWIASSCPNNSPTSLAAGMIVIGSTARPTQLIINIAGKAWIRGFNDPNWSEWMKVADQSVLDSNVAMLNNAVINDDFNHLNAAVFGYGENNYIYKHGRMTTIDGKMVEVESPSRIISPYFFVTKRSVFTFSDSTGAMNIYMFDTDGTYIDDSGWVSSYTIDTNALVRVVIRKASDYPEIDDSEIATLAGYLSIDYKSIGLAMLDSVIPDAVAENADFNNYKTPGTYKVTTTTIAATVSNIPVVNTGKLYVENTSETSYVRQLYTENSTKANIWARYYNPSNNRWYDWVRYANMTDLSTIDNITGSKGLVSMLPAMDSFRFRWTFGITIIGGGTESHSDPYASTDMIPVTPGNIIYNNTPDTGEDGQTTALRIVTYANGTYQARPQVMYGETFVVPDNVNGIRVVYGYASSNTNPHTMTRELLDKYFDLHIANKIEPFGMNSDGEHPVYVAFGASTTIGTVKHKDGADSTLSVYNYPDYVGKVLNLKTYNLGVGGTGFMSRASGNNNFMDQIYRNGDILEKAGLVSIVFGYGNDHYVGPSGEQKLFRIGSYTDYYPFDEEGYHPVGGSAGCVTMVEKGATLMGCLNWCIKWINEHYPYARLVVIFAAPSANDERAVTMTAQQEGEGVAPYTLTFADPFANPAHNSINEGLKQISTELAKLKAALNIPIVDSYFNGSPISWYSTYAKEPENPDDYALFSTTGTTEEPTWDSHPNDEGYKYYSRFIAGEIIQQFKH